MDIAIGNVVKAPIVVDKTELVNAITRAENVDRSLYTGSSLALMDQALADARIINADPDATQPQVDNATATLNDSIDNLELIPPVDKQALLMLLQGREYRQRSIHRLKPCIDGSGLS